MFTSRLDAGKQLADRLREEGIKENSLIVFLSPGGKVVAQAASEILGIPCFEDFCGSKGEDVVIIDDGGIGLEKIKDLVNKLRVEEAHHITVAIPVYSLENTQALKEKADQVIVLEQPNLFISPDNFYENFPEVK